MDNSSKKYQPSIALVFGYILNIDKIPKIASKHGLDRRFSMAFDSHHPEFGEMHFDVSMFENIFTELFKQIEFDLMEVTYGDGEKLTFSSFQDALKDFKKREKPENDTFDGISIFLKDERVGYIQMEYYQSIGGPYPYHDTFNLAFFMRQINRDEILEVVKEICQRNGYLIRAIENGLEAPKQTLMNRLKNLF